MANPVVVLREEFDDWAVLFNPDSANAVGINPIGVAVWKLLDGKHDLDAIGGVVRESFDEVPDQVDQELGDFIDGLEEQGFVGYEVLNEV